MYKIILVDKDSNVIDTQEIHYHHDFWCNDCDKPDIKCEADIATTVREPKTIDEVLV